MKLSVISDLTKGVPKNCNLHFLSGTFGYFKMVHFTSQFTPRILIKQIEYHILCCSTRKNKTFCNLRFEKGCPKKILNLDISKMAHFTSQFTQEYE